jgi:hypothetical protein
MSGSNPNIPRGTLNLLRASVLFPLFPGLTVTASFLAKQGIQVTFQGESTVMIDVMTGRVTSPEPYLSMSMTINLLKTQAFAQTWRNQLESSSLLTQCVVRPDSAAMQPYNFVDVAITGIGDQAFNGSSADYPVRFAGTYYVNNAQWNT